MKNNATDGRLLIVSSCGEELRRLASLAEQRGIPVLRALSFESAVQMVGVVPLSAVVADVANEPIFGLVRRNHVDAILVSLADSICCDTDADKILRRPVDLFVFERLLIELFEPVDSQQDAPEVEREPVRAR